MEDVSKSGRTILFVSHNMGAVRNLCTRGILLDEGVCTFVGTSGDAVDHYMLSVSNKESANHTKSRKRSLPGTPNCMQITNVELENIKLGCINEAETLDELVMKINYEILTEVDWFSAEWRLKDTFGTNLSYSSSAPMGDILFYPKDGEKYGQIICHFPRIPLSMGEYVFDVGLVKPGIRFLDYIQDVCRLTIRASDPLKTGYQYKRQLAPFFIDCTWSKADESLHA